MIKYTTNYICYFSAMSKLTCAKCRLSGRFVKLSIAQVEYDIEYAYTSSYKAILAMLWMLWCVCIIKPKRAATSEMSHSGNDIERLNNAMNIDCLNKAIIIAYFNCDYILFSKLNRERFELIKGI